MKSFVISVVVLLCVLSVSSSFHLGEDLKFSNRSSPYDCSGTGTQCGDNCRDLVTCSEPPTIVGTCGPGQVCISSRCMAPPRFPECSPIDGLAFTCAEPGMYPHASDCKKYVICTSNGATAITIDCEGPTDEYGYNPRTFACDKKLTNRLCETYPIPLCKKIEALPLTTNPSYYYQCRYFPGIPGVIYPYQRRCPNGQRFSAATERCS